MSAPYKHVSASRIMGSWPIVGSIGMASPSILPRTVLGSARIIGSRRAPGAGFAVGGLSFYLWVDGVQKTATFSAGNKTLAQVITEVNGATTPDVVAYDDNGFLRLESESTGPSSSLRLATNTSSSVFAELGLFSETESQGGDLVSTPTYDVTRQIAYPGQLSWAEGEDVESRVFNRALFQLAVNADLSDGVISKKRVAIQKQSSVFTYTPPGGGDPDGVTIPGPGSTYTGKVATEADLQRFFLVVDQDGKELVKEMRQVLDSSAALTWATDVDSGDLIVTAPGAFFSSTDPTTDVYLVPSNLAPPADVLNTHPLKIIRFISTTQVVVSPVNPLTGQIITPITQTPVTAQRVSIYTVPCRVTGVYDGPGVGAALITNTPVQRQAPTAVTRVDLGNRVYCPAANFASVLEGDKVIYAGTLIDVPFSNNGTYRVSKVIDSKTLELVAEDWGPAVLNPNIPGGDPATVEVTTDGMFWPAPFVRFNAAKAIPASGEQFSIIHYTMSTLRAATDDPSTFLGAGLKVSQELDYLTQKAILSIIGPSATTIDEYVRDDRRVNLEDLDLRLDLEHYEHDGRHQVIRPDRIDMYPESGITFTMEDERLHVIGDTPTNLVGIGQTTPYPPPSPLPNGTYYYVVAARDLNGGESLLSNEVFVVIDGITAQFVKLTWDLVPEASHYRVYRGTASGVYTQHRDMGANIGVTIDHQTTVWAAGGPPGGASTFYATQISGPSYSSFVQRNFGIGSPVRPAMTTGGELGGALSIGIPKTENAAVFCARMGETALFFPDITYSSEKLYGLDTSQLIATKEFGAISAITAGDANAAPYINQNFYTTGWEISNSPPAVAGAKTAFRVNVVGQAIVCYEDTDPPMVADFTIRKPSGIHFTITNTSATESWSIRSRPGGNFLVDVGTTSPQTIYPMLFDTDTGYVGIGFNTAVPDSAPDGPLHVQSRGNSILNTVFEQVAVVSDHAGGPRLLLELDHNTVTGGATNDGDVTGALWSRGTYAADTYALPWNSAINFKQVGTASASNAGSSIEFRTTPQDTVVPQLAFDILDDGDIFAHQGLLFDSPRFDRRIQEVATAPRLASSCSASPALNVYSQWLSEDASLILTTTINALVPWRDKVWVVGTDTNGWVMVTRCENEARTIELDISVAQYPSFNNPRGAVVSGDYLYVLCDRISTSRPTVLKIRMFDRTLVGFDGVSVSAGLPGGSGIFTDGLGYIYITYRQSTNVAACAKYEAFPTAGTQVSIINEATYNEGVAINAYDGGESTFDGDYVWTTFWANPNSRVIRFNANIGTGTAVGAGALYTSHLASQPVVHGMASDGPNVYWWYWKTVGNEGHIMRFKSGGLSDMGIFDTSGGTHRDARIMVDDHHLYVSIRDETSPNGWWPAPHVWDKYSNTQGITDPNPQTPIKKSNRFTQAQYGSIMVLDATHFWFVADPSNVIFRGGKL